MGAKGEAAFADFCARFGDEVGIEIMERMCDVAWSKTGRDRTMHIHDVHEHNACNHTFFGTVEHGGVVYGFIVHSGDWGGTNIEAWGPEEDIGTYDPPKPTIYTFVPRDAALKFDRPGLWEVFLHWQQQSWFQDKVRGYNYDRHFAPGGRTETHYRDWAATKGLRIVTDEEAQRIIDQPASEAPVPLNEILAAWEALP